MPLSEADQRNFQMLAHAFNNRDVVLVECQVVETGQTIPVICAINHRPPNRIEIIPCAELLSGNPYRLVNLPRADGNGFVTQAELRGELN